MFPGGSPSLVLPPIPGPPALHRIIRAALRAADPASALQTTCSLRGHWLDAAEQTYDLRRVQRIVVVGAGKAALSMARTVSRLLGTRLDGGIVVVPALDEKAVRIPRLDVVAAGHPVPDRRSVLAARRLRATAASLQKEDLLIVLLSGGASSLLSLPENGLTLGDKQRTTWLLLRSGATIAEVNTVRKHLSAIKGGRLAEATRAQVLTLVLSDVQGDDLGVIGSGPTAPDPTRFRDAVEILRRYRLWERMPVRVRVHLVEGLGGWQTETPKPANPIFRRVRYVVIGNNRRALEAAAEAARRAGYALVQIEDFLTGDAAATGQWMGAWGRQLATRLPRGGRLCLLAGGELTVTVRGRGVGGRAQEFVLAAALDLRGIPAVWAVGVGTDGRDGPTDVAGAVADGGTMTRAQQQGLDAAAFLRRHDSYRFFHRAGGHIKTGPTGTNVNDLYMIFVHG